MRICKPILLPLLGAMCLGAILCVAGCTTSADTGAQSSAGGAAKQYTCAMHPDVVSDKPGKCPKCGMALVEKK